MKIVHITPHLGGGVGKAHAALCEADEETADRHYVLLEAPRDTRHADTIRQSGAAVSIAPDMGLVRDLISSADLIQFEWWNHPLMCGLLAGPPLPPMRTVFWSHVSGISTPFIPKGLVEAADRFVFTSECSRLAGNMAGLDADVVARTEVINSGFGYPSTGGHQPRDHRGHGISYLGTVEFTKMNPAMMEVIDRVAHSDVIVDVWGGVEASSPVHDAIAAMKHPGRFRLRGQTQTPREALQHSSIFLYLLQPFHFGTAENALVEAMSLGCAPLVLANPCELAIVRHGETGLVAQSADHAVELLTWMLEHPQEVCRMGEAARKEVSEAKTPERSIAAFRRLWQSTLAQPKRIPDLGRVLGSTPRDWHAVLQGVAYARDTGLQSAQSASKGSLAHFEAYYPDLDQAPTNPV
ncbi:glycosyltransferase [Hoeflea sp.]|uniref:glycosyltransferase n=1 Tax=Hoeflea sp. TaxID=1940281 RepID=UPI0037479336